MALFFFSWAARVRGEVQLFQVHRNLTNRIFDRLRNSGEIQRNCGPSRKRK